MTTKDLQRQIKRVQEMENALSREKDVLKRMRAVLLSVSPAILDGLGMDSHIDCLPLTIRTSTCLSNKRGVSTLRDVDKFTDAELLCTPNFGRKSLQEIRDLIVMIRDSNDDGNG